MKNALLNHRFNDGSSIQDKLDFYNEGKRKDRQKTIDDLLSQTVAKKENGKTTRQPMIRQQAMVLQVGGKETYIKELGKTYGGQIPEEIAVDILKEAYEELARDDRFIIMDAYIHLDETTPHLEYHYIPVMECERKQGVNLDFSPNNVHKAMISPERLLEAENDLKSREAQNVRDGNSQLNNPLLRNKCEYRAFNATITDILREKSLERGVEIENPEIEGRGHGNQDEWRKNEELKRQRLEMEHEKKEIKHHSLLLASKEDSLNKREEDVKKKRNIIR
jgi:hypothetical protein